MAGDASTSDTPAVDFISMPGSPSVSLDNVPVVPADGIVIPSPGGTASGCAAEDYPAAVAGAVALVQRGTCPFVQKWEVAQDAGAVAVIIFNEGDTAARQNALFIDNQLVGATAPAVISSFALGQELYNAFQAGQNPTVDLQTFGTFTDRFFNQVIAETPKGDPDNVVVVGAHLDSVPAGPGINDDGSGTALLLTMAQRLARPGHPLKQKIRFGWWGAEEEGLIGSSYYADNLSDDEVSKIDVMLDYDMLSSPNYARLVYDGDGSEGDNPAGPDGSGTVEEVYREWFASKRQPVVGIPFDGRSDYVGFTDQGIPAGGVFAGAEGVKTENQERIFGGDAGSWYDPCYHQACDDITTVLTGVPPLEAEGLAVDIEDATDADKAVAAQKMRGGLAAAWSSSAPPRRTRRGTSARCATRSAPARGPRASHAPRPRRRPRSARATRTSASTATSGSAAETTGYAGRRSRRPAAARSLRSGTNYRSARNAARGSRWRRAPAPPRRRSGRPFRPC